MIQTVQKRDGRIVNFDSDRIVNAIMLAMQAVHKAKPEAMVDVELAKSIATKIAATDKEQLSVEQIQDAVELELMHSERPDVAISYIKYRSKQAVVRECKMHQVFDSIIGVKVNDITRENANMNADTPSGQMMKFASESTKPYVDNYLLSDEAKHAVQDNLIHIHDKDFYPTKSLTCVQHPLNTILLNGFKAAHAESRPAKRIETASVQACISLETAQNEMHTLNCAA